MSLRTTAGRLLLEEALPPGLRHHASAPLDKKGIQNLFRELARDHPEEYRATSKRLLDIGREVSYLSGGYSFGLRHLRQAQAARTHLADLQQQIGKVLAADLPHEEKQQQIVRLAGDLQKPLEEAVYKESLKDRNPIALQVLSGSRGSPANLRSLRGADLLYVDSRDRVIPLPVLNSYAHGLDPAEYYAGAFGARRGVVDVKRSVADAGFFCLAKGTEVKLPDWSALPIEKIEPGDLVTGSDLEGHPVTTRVMRVYAHGKKECRRYYFAKGLLSLDRIEVVATPEHRILVYLKHEKRHALMPLGELAPGHLAQLAVILASDSRYELLGHAPAGELETYDLEVSHPDHLFVLANRLVVSNSKQLAQATHRLLVTAHDTDDPAHARRGLPVATDDPDNEGALLSYPAGGYARNTVLTPAVLKDLKSQGIDDLVVRSPVTGGAGDGGLYARDVGVRERGGLPPIGDMVGLASSQAEAEVVAQAGLSSKHSGGIAGTGTTPGGFQALNNLVQSPKVYPGGATHAQFDGRVTGVDMAPAGGAYVTVGERRHYVPAGLGLKVKPGDEVEAGDVLSEGVPVPGEIVSHKGVGEGRRYLALALRDATKASGLLLHRRNAELIARGLINHVRLHDEIGPYAPNDVVPYDLLERSWRPRPDAEEKVPGDALGLYLEEPVLHHTVGTKIKPSLVRDLRKFGIDRIKAHREPPPFEPLMVRGMDTLAADPDWLTRMLGSNQEKHLLRGTHRGHVSDPLGTSYVPAVIDTEHFNRRGLVRGWQPEGRGVLGDSGGAPS